MGVVDFSQYLNEAIQAGRQVEGNVVKIIADNGDEIGDAVFKVIQGGNGTGTEVGVATQTGAGGAIATGLAYLNMTIPTVFAAIAPCLGIVAGFGMYNLAPEWWDARSAELVEAGTTVGGKIIAYWDGLNLHIPQKVIEIFKSGLVSEGMFNYNADYPVEDGSLFQTYTHPASSNFPLIAATSSREDNLQTIESHNYTLGNGGANLCYFINGRLTQGVKLSDVVKICDSGFCGQAIKQYILDNYANTRIIAAVFYPPNPTDANYWFRREFTFIIQGPYDAAVNKYYNGTAKGCISGSSFLSITAGQNEQPSSVQDAYNSIYERYGYADYFDWDYANVWMIDGSEVPNELQPGAIYPNVDPFPESYPTWIPYEYPQSLPDPSELPTVYPVKYPGTEPDPYPEQEPAQNPDPESVPDTYPVIIPDFPIPEPGLPEPSPEPATDPDPQPEPDPIPDPSEPSPSPDPIDPNPNPNPSLPIVVPNLPSTVNSNKLFTVYNPTASQLDGLGGYLWDSSIIAALRDIWQDPMDGLISLQQVFVTPSTSGSHNIILGFLDSGVSSKVVSNQFVTVDCGSVTIEENKENATDYSPYTSLHLYLPFIGIVELDVDECMNSTMSVTYKVDVYTGTCLAQVSIDRNIDMPDDPILYTFSGNCSQQLPLTSGNSVGLLTALIGAVGAGIKASAGGALGTLAGAQLLGNSLSHEMMHVSHSGNISANAGIMGQKKPYVIIGRRHGYDANNYNSFYGFPANKTINIGNHSGFLRVKKCWLKTSALKEEYEEIMKILEDGIFV